VAARALNAAFQKKLWEDAIAAGKWPVAGKLADQCPSLDKACMEAYAEMMAAEAKWMREEIRYLDRKPK
jgi:hypothetical protein